MFVLFIHNKNSTGENNNEVGVMAKSDMCV